MNTQIFQENFYHIQTDICLKPMTEQIAGDYVIKSVNFSVDHSITTLQEETVSSVQMTHLLLTKQRYFLTKISSIVSMDRAVMVSTSIG